MAQVAHSNRDEPERPSQQVSILSWDSNLSFPNNGISLAVDPTWQTSAEMFLPARISEKFLQTSLAKTDENLRSEYSRFFWTKYLGATSNVVALDDQRWIFTSALDSAMFHRLWGWKKN